MPSSGFAHESILGVGAFQCWSSATAIVRAAFQMVTAADEPDRDRQMAYLVEAGIVGAAHRSGKPRF